MPDQRSPAAPAGLPPGPRRVAGHVPAGGGTFRPSLWGEQLHRKVGGELTGGAFTLDELTTVAGWGRGSYVDHGADECFYVLMGSFRLDVEGPADPVLVTPGAVAYVPRGTACAITQISSGPGRLLIVQTPAPPSDDPAAAPWRVERIDPPSTAAPAAASTRRWS